MEKNKKKMIKLDITYSVFDCVPLENMSIGWVFPFLFIETVEDNA